MGVEFPLDPFNVETSHYVDYRDFIRNLRRRLGERASHNLPALAIYTNDPSRIRFFDLVLETNNHAVTFRLRMDNLYLIGYQMEDDRWFEFGRRGDQHLITEPGTAFLGFGGNYDCLPVDRTRVGFLSLVSAINQLAGTVNRQARERSLVVVNMMICESARFVPVFEYMASSFQHNPYTTTPWDTSVIRPWIMNLVTSWETLSALLLRADAYPHETIHDLGIIQRNNIRIPPNDTAITSIPAAIGVLGILLGLCFSRREQRLVSRMASDDGGQCFSGIPLVHVFSAQINDIDGEDPGQLYGTITINNGFNTEYIYNRTSDNYESISPGQQVTLTGPSYSVPAFGSFTIKVLLTDYDTISLDDEIIDEEDLIPWYAAGIKNEYDKLITSEVFSSIGSVTIKYAVFENAVAARVVVNLGGGGEVTTGVYGHVSARYDKQWGMEPTATCMLFNRASDDYVEVNRWQNFPLSRSLVAVPLNHSLKVTAKLYDTFSADDLIANGTVDFPVPESLPAISTKDIYGEDGDRVTVSIHWSSGLSE